jgi:hypothetical protein
MVPWKGVAVACAELLRTLTPTRPKRAPTGMSNVAIIRHRLAPVASDERGPPMVACLSCGCQLQSRALPSFASLWAVCAKIIWSFAVGGREDTTPAGDGGTPDGDDRPWERPGELRRDCEPHRGVLIRLLGISSLLCFPLALLGPCFWKIYAGNIPALPFGLFGVAGLVLGRTSWCIASADLRKMFAGVMDREGMIATTEGKRFAIMGVLLSAVPLTIFGTLFFETIASWCK